MRLGVPKKINSLWIILKNLKKSMSKRAEVIQASAILPESIISYAKEHAVLSGLVYREGVKYGYEQAEKDLALTWEDVRTILDKENDILHECNDNAQQVIEVYPKGEDYYGEILKRFNEQREKK